MSEPYIHSLVTIPFHKLTVHRRRQLAMIIDAYRIVRDIPSARWSPISMPPEFNQHNLFGHYYNAKVTPGTVKTLSGVLAITAPLRAALNDFITSDYEVGSILEGIAIGPVPFSDAEACIPDYRSIAISLLQLIISKYPAPEVSMTDANRYKRPLTKPVHHHVRMPYKD